MVHQPAYQAPTMFSQLDLGLVVPSFLPTDDLIASINKAMAFISTAFFSNYPPTNKQLRILSNPRRKTDSEIWGGEVLMAKLSTYDSNVLSEVPIQDTYYDNFVLDQCVEGMHYSEQLISVDDSYIEIISNNNVISYEQYMKQNESEVVQDTTSSGQHNAMIMSKIKKSTLRKQPALYYGHTIVKKHDALYVIDFEVTLELAEATRLKMSEKQNDPIVKEKRVNIKLIGYGSLNELYKHFVPKKQLSTKQAFWLPISKTVSEQTSSVQPKSVRIDIPREMPTIKEAEMKKHIEIVQDDGVEIDAIPLATKPPVIVEWKIIKEGKMGYFQLIRADGSSKRYSSMIWMLQNIDREDLETLWKLVKAKHGNTRPEEAYERVLWGDLKVMFEPGMESKVWRNLQGYNGTVWKLFSSSGVHFVRFQNLHIFMLVEKKYPLTPATITKMLNKKLQTD
ncbi:hypothetical protein Tco_0216149 [Tanacetum coccineum]